MSEDPNKQKEPENRLADVKQLGICASLASLGYVFWILGGMEMIERLAYYGVRSVATIYATRPASEGGLGVTMAKFGTLLLLWNLMQTFVPIFLGGLADKYGYKQTMFLATLLKLLGYIVMALFPTYWGFFAGAMLLANGTAIFKPGIQGSLIGCTNRKNSAVAWGTFYQIVNLGAWLGPLIALHMRQENWSLVFYTNGAIICINFVLLFTYKEPGIEQRLERQAKERRGELPKMNLIKEAIEDLKKPYLSLYLLIFCVFWFMFPMLWDVLPKYIDDWVDTTVIVKTLFGPEGTANKTIHFLMGMNESGLKIEPEGIVNLNSFMIMLTCFIFAGLSARFRATTTLFYGTLLVVVALACFGLYTSAWVIVACMVVFSIGEMLTGPKYGEFIGNIAPPDKKAMWMGFTQAPVLIGWTLEGKIGPSLYEHFSSKDRLSRLMITEKFDPAIDVSEKAIPIGEAFQKLVEISGKTPTEMQSALYNANHVGMVWFVFAIVGMCSAIMIYTYGLWYKKYQARPASEQK